MKWLKVLMLVGVLVNGTAIVSWADNYRGGNNPGYDDYSERVEAGVIISDRDSQPGGGYVRVDAFPLSVNIGVPGFWRLSVRPGFTWVDGFWKGEIYVPGYYRPNRDRGRNWAWVPGHWGGDRWLPGRWRPSQRAGYDWIEGHWTREGEWIEGFWRPLARAPRGMVWEPGYWNARGWVEGFWRVEVKPGFIWIGGDWDDRGNWVCGRWERAQKNHIWQRRVWNSREGHWHPGQLVKLPENHQGPLRHGYYNPRGEWVSPYDREEHATNYGDRREERYNEREDRRNDRHHGYVRENRPSEQEQLENSRRDREGRPSEQQQLNSSRQDRERSGGQIQKINSAQQHGATVSGAGQGQSAYQDNSRSNVQAAPSEGGQLRKLDDSSARQSGR